MSLEFGFQDAIDEVRAFGAIATSYSDVRSLDVLPSLARQLEIVRDTVTEAEYCWGIRDEAPFFTKPSLGQYQPNDQGEYTVYARITSTWGIQRVRPPGKKTARAERFRLTGNASTLVRLIRVATDAGPETDLTTWREDIGAADSPGCHFHVQIYRDSEAPPNPKSLDVPRLPAVLVTPTAVIDYVLGELFQKDWPSHVAGKTAELNRLWPIQRRRLGALLAWKFQIVNDATASPWTTLKRTKPEADLFMLPELPRLLVR